MIFESSLSDLVVVGELCGQPLGLKLEQDLNQALAAFLESGYGQMPVLGLLQHEDVIEAYRNEVLRHSAKF